MHARASNRRYAALLPAEVVSDLPESAFCEVVALACDVAHADYALGFTLLFLKAGKGAFLEDLLDMDMQAASPPLAPRAPPCTPVRPLTWALTCSKPWSTSRV